MAIDETEVEIAEISAIVFDIKKNTFDAWFCKDVKPLFSIYISYHEMSADEWVNFTEIYEPDGYAIAHTPTPLIRLRWKIESISNRFMRMFKKGVKIHSFK